MAGVVWRSETDVTGESASASAMTGVLHAFLEVVSMSSLVLNDIDSSKINFNVLVRNSRLLCIPYSIVHQRKFFASKYRCLPYNSQP